MLSICLLFCFVIFWMLYYDVVYEKKKKNVDNKKKRINAYYKKIKVFFDLACMSTCCWGLPKPKYEPFITHNRGTLEMS